MAARPRLRRTLPPDAGLCSEPPPLAEEGSEGGWRKRRVCVGIVTGPHGVRGAVRIKSFTAVPEDIAGYGPVADEPGRRRFRLQVIGHGRGVLLARLSGVADRNQAEALRGLRLYLPRAALPPPGPEEYYHADLIGLAAVLADGAAVGTVRAVHDFGAGDMLEIARPGAAPAMVPFTRAIVPEVDIAAGRLVLDPPAGMLDGGPAHADEPPPQAFSSRPDAIRASAEPGDKPGHDAA